MNDWKIVDQCDDVTVSPHLGRVAMFPELQRGGDEGGEAVPALHLLLHPLGPQRGRVSEWVDRNANGISRNFNVSDNPSHDAQLHSWRKIG